jgi:hypothetical protein
LVDRNGRPDNRFGSASTAYFKHQLKGISPVKILNDLGSYATAISAAWTKLLSSILEASKLSAQADKELPADDKARLIEQLPFEAPTFSKLVKIGNDARLYTDRMRGLLPPSYSILYEIALCSDAQLNYAVESGILHCEATRADIEEIRKSKIDPARLPVFDDECSDASEQTAQVTGVVRCCFAEFHVPADYPAERREELANELARVAQLYDAKLVKIPTDIERAEMRYEKALNAFARRWERIGRKLALARVNDLKRDARKRNKKWCYEPDEIEINSGDGWDRIEDVMGFVGLEAEIDELRAKAESLAEAPEMPAELCKPANLADFWRPKKKYNLNDFSDWNFKEEFENVE